MKLSTDSRTLQHVDLNDITADGHFDWPGTVTKIAWDAFKNKTNLIQTIVPEGLTEIGGNAFRGCTNLDLIILHEGLERIRVQAFKGCTNIAVIIIPESVTVIDAHVFQGCTSLDHIVINTQNAAEFDRIRSLLPAALQDKIIDRANYEALPLQGEALRKRETLADLCRAPQVHSLASASFFSASDEVSSRDEERDTLDLGL